MKLNEFMDKLYYSSAYMVSEEHKLNGDEVLTINVHNITKKQLLQNINTLAQELHFEIDLRKPDKLILPIVSEVNLDIEQQKDLLKYLKNR